MPVTVTIGDVIAKIQSEVFPKRMRMIEFFKDYDVLQTKEVTPTQFNRCLDLIMKGKITVPEIDCLLEYFKTVNGFVNYKAFCDEIEKIFTTRGLHVQPTMNVTKPGDGLKDARDALPAPDAEMSAILHRVALLVKTRGIVMKYCYEDSERSDSTSLVVRRRAGKVTLNQFKRCFPFPSKEFSPREVDMIAARYGDGSGLVDYKTLHEEVTDPADVVQEPEVPKSDFIAGPGRTEWSSEQFNILERVTARVIELRIGLINYFQDFDNLRKGYVTFGQLDTVLSILNLKFSEADRDSLKQMYEKKDLHFSLFNYAKFCKDVNSAFTYDMIHTNPLARIEMPSAESTLPSRRSRQVLSDEDKLQIAEIEEDIRARVRKRRILFQNAFKDFDRIGSGHVSANQFCRVMQTMNLQCDADQAELLGKRYCDLGNKTDFNYREFCLVCDPASESLQLAESQNMAPYQKPQPSKYFDLAGTVYEAP